MQTNPSIFSHPDQHKTNSLTNGQSITGPPTINLVEMIGPPGVGKSTLYRALSNTWNNKLSWTCMYGNAETRNPQHYRYLYRLEKLLRSILRKPYSVKMNVESGINFSTNYPELTRFLWNLLSDKKTYSNDEYDKRFRSAYFLFKDFCRLQSIIENQSGKVIVTDEGLLQKSFLINQDKELIPGLIARYAALIPAPRAIVHLDTSNPDIIIRRLRGRDKKIASHIGLSNAALYADLNRWQYLFTVIIQQMEHKRVRILKLDGENSLNHNVMLFKHFLDTL